jgi:hypothetical protein
LSIGEITFNYNKFKENWLKEYIIECLKLEGISCIKNYISSKDAYLRITNRRNYLIFWKIGLFDRCKRKKDMFLEVLKERGPTFLFNS